MDRIIKGRGAGVIRSAARSDTRQAHVKSAPKVNCDAQIEWLSDEVLALKFLVFLLKPLNIAYFRSKVFCSPDIRGKRNDEIYKQQAYERESLLRKGDAF